MKHPAKYSDPLLPIFESLLAELQGDSKVLDPFAGTGKIHLLPFDTYGVEIEPEWARMHPKTVCADSCDMPFESESFDAICTSPTYGNRMSDHHNAKDTSSRNTYTHTLGRQLSDNNSGKMPWGDSYKELHQKVYLECFRVLRPGGSFILNIKNHIRHGVEVDVTAWHIEALESLEFRLEVSQQIPLPGNRFGANGVMRVPYESVILFKKGIDNLGSRHPGF